MGLMFEAPPNGNEIPAQSCNVNSTPLEPVILTREMEIRRDAVGNDHVNHGTGAAVPLDAMTMADAYIPLIPGSFPGLTPEVHVESPQIDASMETMPRSTAPIPHDTVLLNDRHDPSGVADVLERNSINEKFVPVPVRTPFHFKGKEATILAGSKRKANAPPPIPRLNKKKQKTGGAEHDVVDAITPPATPSPVVIFAGVAPHGTKRRQYKQPDDKQTTVKRQRIDSSIPEREEVEEIRLTSPEEVEKHIRAKNRRKVNFAPAPPNVAVNPPMLVPLTADLGSEVCPLTHLRGQREVEYVVPAQTQSTLHVEPTVRSRRRKGAEDVTLPPRKKQRIA
ncbi:uncharacterized protein SPPG_07205 [Spizellomyces punctatus DAOM BR117]|uniref:Uncharacterized protein n=1 Tax=Spizellomyces punctatus (strain DAOM BR117) TaxID=645134 RepID=A0A0L0H7S4_SPIPD|nr:uncharacterized protein SPPG_07205 [Spizellomyces punctatus DAOM BR117]KNC97277.1 hypothetical protein SPPG_07205 [Spizellomyces punctatus DAOM BR117]|eukprot:XP_016605317.1 hypothetical protein SPPG_07205 [Spizellomyces punctatus DAOM BR117]